MVDVDDLGLGQAVGFVIAVVGDLGGGVAVDGFFGTIAVLVEHVVGARMDDVAFGVCHLLHAQRGVVAHVATGAVAVRDLGVESGFVVGVAGTFAGYKNSNC
ncbi:hypothetical protein H8K55_21325 [Undibacterium sp. LX15W]|uniref:Uncharacterized protein n=1 Tax=Undibacterium flavidum TaxID=2762297 RepID=A0ABR6YHY0_9BURK|nr:hypothetical protein [Undibacterium flavidum]